MLLECRPERIDQKSDAPLFRQPLLRRSEHVTSPRALRRSPRRSHRGGRAALLDPGVRGPRPGARGQVVQLGARGGGRRQRLRRGDLDLARSAPRHAASLRTAEDARILSSERQKLPDRTLPSPRSHRIDPNRVYMRARTDVRTIVRARVCARRQEMCTRKHAQCKLGGPRRQ